MENLSSTYHITHTKTVLRSAFIHSKIPGKNAEEKVTLSMFQSNFPSKVILVKH